MEITKRTRSSNWTGEDKKVLKKLVLERADIIENKNCSGHTNRAKKNAWGEVLFCFNTICKDKRDIGQLMTQWKRMKMKEKNMIAYQLTRTCPSSSSPPPEDCELLEVEEFTIENDEYDSEQNSNKFEHATIVSMPTPSNSPWSLKSEKLQMDDPMIVLETSMPTVPTSIQQKPESQQSKKNCCSKKHEHELFVLAKKAREEAMLRDKEAHECKMRNDREIHKRRMELINLEAEYWRQKIRSFQ